MKPQDDESKRAAAEHPGALDSAVGRAARHFGTADAPPDDKAELWGRRIGRAMSLVGVLVLTLLLIYQLRQR